VAVPLYASHAVVALRTISADALRFFAAMFRIAD